MISYKCSLRTCRIADERLLPIIAEAINFRCPECGSALERRDDDSWSLAISMNPQLWAAVEASSIPFFVRDEILRLRGLFRDGQVYGAMLQIKDVLEILLKLPVLLGAGRVISFAEITLSEREFLFSLISKPLSLGDWRSIATKSLTSEVRIPASIRQLIADIARLFDREQVPTWRNNTIGHGALGFDTDNNLRADIEEKVLAVAEYLQNTAHLYNTFDITVQHEEKEISLRQSLPIELSHASNAVSVALGSEAWSVFPYIHLIEGGIFFFDAYYHYRHRTTALLNYTDGHKRLERLRRLAELYEHLVLSTQLKVMQIEFEPRVRSKEQEELFFRDRREEDIVEPKALTNWLRTALHRHDRGVFLIQLERGCGKTTFCRYIDGLGISGATFDNLTIRVYYGNDLYGYAPANFAWSITDMFRADRSNVITGDIPFFSPNSDDKPRALAEHLEFFLRQRKRLYGARRLMLVIDGVDESPLGGSAPILDFIPNPRQLQSGIYILLTTRTNAELLPALQRRLSNLDITGRMIITRNDVANRDLLVSYLQKTKVPEVLWDALMKAADWRVLYLRTLVGALTVLSASNVKDLPRGDAVVEVFLERLGIVYGPRHYEYLLEIVATLVFAYEPLTSEEICFLTSEPYPSLRAAAFLKDISGILRVDRGEQGNVFGISHEEIATTLRRRFLPRHRLMATAWIESLKEYASSLLIHPSPGLDYLLAHLTEYDETATERLSQLDLAEQLIDYSLRSDPSFTFARRQRLILVAAFRWLDARRDPAAYAVAAGRVPTKVLEQVLETRLTDRDATLMRLLQEPKVENAGTRSFFRTLAASAYHTQNYKDAIALADKLYNTTRSTIDLVNLALTLKGIDTDIDGAYTMARSRQIAEQLYRSDYLKELEPRQRGYLLYTIGRIFSDMQEHTEHAMGIFVESLTIFEELGDDLAMFALKNSIALCLEDFDEAYSRTSALVSTMQEDSAGIPRYAFDAVLLNAYMLSFLASKERADPFESQSASRWEIYAYHLNNRFIVEVSAKNWENAEKFAAECLRLTESERGVYSRAAILNNVGVVYNRAEDIAAAYEICKSSGYSIGEAITGINLGRAYPRPRGILRHGEALLWPCFKNIDVLAYG
jgi:hypothetical protein